MITDLFSFDEYVTCDFEYHAPPGEIPEVINMAAHENVSGRKFLLWGDEFRGMEQPPFRIDERTLFICFAATAELSAFHALRWPEPCHILDLYAEGRVLHNGKFKGKGKFGLLETCRRYGVNGIAADEKTATHIKTAEGLHPIEQCAPARLALVIKSLYHFLQATVLPFDRRAFRRVSITELPTKHSS